MSQYKLGSHSLRELQGVHPTLVTVVKHAIEITEQDFTVFDGIRTEAEQREYVARGVSKTMNSRHLTGHAVDLVPWINNRLRWEWEPIFVIAVAMQRAAKDLETPIRWGGSWTRIDNTDKTPKELKAAHDGWDGPHFELPRDLYPV